ncbi:hypothetical protein BCE_3052 [Bacillus cereus ATCC 10987]|uniref:Uncharacterized protein n=1 Tax=Bacillus cereus (strain ATCC 10987 / NRS 248) TaxID=222523 RepID=Q735U9_BACC1|nr:hypothetical protein BCE_3052 [Bacillus cereus ATCC 10987]
MYHSFQNINGYFYILTNYSENLYGFSIQRNKYSIIKLYSCTFWNANI